MEECLYLYEIKCKGCGRTTEMTVIAGPDYPDIDGIEWLDRQLAALKQIRWVFHEGLGAYCQACSQPN
jgi:hypothetical protein